MTATPYSEVQPKQVSPGRTRYLTYTGSMMLTVWDFSEPFAAPDPPHSHPHEQVSYVAEGEVLFFLDGQPTRLGPGSVVSIPGGVPHSIQVLSDHARLIDCFHPIREEFIE